MGVFKDNGKEQFIKLYEAYVDEVYKYVYLRTGLNKTIAEDITQDIFTNVFKGMGKFKGLCSERSWIFKITKNKVNDFYRKKYSIAREEEDIDSAECIQLADYTQDVQENILTKIQSDSVKACLSLLSQQYSLVLIMKYMDGMTIKEISSIIGKTPKATESILQRARRAFIKQYEGRG